MVLLPSGAKIMCDTNLKNLRSLSFLLQHLVHCYRVILEERTRIEEMGGALLLIRVSQNRILELDTAHDAHTGT